jgi:AraC-like DNA-binding protein
MSMDIPFSCTTPGVQMIFSLDAPSFFNDRKKPLTLAPASHSLNFFKQYDCRNLLAAHARQNDIVFRLEREFYADIMTRHLAHAEAGLPAMILQQREFNTINQHLPSDAAIQGILTSILHCPFSGPMRAAYLREHVAALLNLQLFHFSRVVTRHTLPMSHKLTPADREVLQEVKRYIDEHYLDPASLQSLSKRFGINEFKLKHVFRVLFDTSPIRYLQWKRLQHSRRLLSDTNMTLQQIADSIGYTHAANFTTAFKRAFGKHPSYHRVRLKHACQAAWETTAHAGN